MLRNSSFKLKCAQVELKRFLKLQVYFIIPTPCLNGLFAAEISLVLNMGVSRVEKCSVTPWVVEAQQAAVLCCCRRMKEISCRRLVHPPDLHSLIWVNGFVEERCVDVLIVRTKLGKIPPRTPATRLPLHRLKSCGKMLLIIIECHESIIENYTENVCDE